MEQNQSRVKSEGESERERWAGGGRNPPPPPFFFYFFLYFLFGLLGFWNLKREVGEVAKSVRAVRSSAARSGVAAKIKKSGNIKYCRGRGYLSPAVFQSLSLRSSVGTFTTTL